MIAKLRIPTFEDVRDAQARIAGNAHRTPVLTSRTANAMVDGELFFKAENLQRAGAFKFRGAYNAVSALDADARRKGVVAFSSGNHAQALAYAATLLGAPSVIVMPKDAPEIKVAATRGYGAEVVFFDRYSDDREAIARAISEERGMAMIPPFDHPDIIAGQGTAALELIEEVGELDMLITPLGGGGLLAGCALSAKALNPDCRVIGVEPEAGNDGQQSLQKGEVVRIAPPKSIADGALTTFVGYHNFPILQSKVDGIVTVSDGQLVSTMRFFAERMKIIVEPTGCLGASAALNNVVDCAGKRVGIVLSGGNVDLKALSGFFAGA
ncbi:threo-3-hydroxy-L-aspartate ammonia-lyase [Aminobacter sp. AP02]|uniref:threo-3-hydroxy-L-aspartate ammonia-lyase n=1 Tax=Aminobacter sp. AP02 TaxID=2135737 RepID=UPI000D6D87B1|nr:threo-3-hydroxy-L-aspartate ammonia-lyase [Aminobacter sp. AP02]PWK69712.1 threonine dehydratase [Aminobacter sp. AP02]